MTTLATNQQPQRRATASTSPQKRVIHWADYPALVFSGSIDALGEIPCEPTAEVPFKFALADPRNRPHEDFARMPNMPLPLWPEHRIEPIDGICFVLADSRHPALPDLTKMGAVEGEHFIVLELIERDPTGQQRLHRLKKFVEQLSSTDSLLLLGYGDQGATIASQLRDQHGISPSRVAVFDDRSASQERAKREGFALAGIDALDRVHAVIYTPLQRYGRLQSMLDRAAQRNLPVFDNAISSTGRDYFAQRNRIWLDRAAARALRIHDANMRPGAHGLPLEVHMVREDHRQLGSATIRHLATVGHFKLLDSWHVLDTSAPDRFDAFAVSTFRGLNRAFVSITGTRELPVFAARALCEDCWPVATRRVIPAACAVDLGSTAFERILHRHITKSEIISASQRTTQQVVLGIAVNHYASESPIIEVGSALGGSGAIMAAATNSPTAPAFLSIDPETATRHVMRWAFDQYEQLHRLQQINETSDAAIAHLQHLHGQAGLVFIDGLHTAEAMHRDFINYAPLVRPGGALVIHDVEPARYSVLRIVIEHVMRDPRFKPLCLVDGLLVLERV